MWYLQQQTSPVGPRGDASRVPVYYWFGGVDAPPRTIGRKNVDIRLKATSVSRTHAMVRVRHSSFQRRTHATVPTVEDSSAYGTFLKYPPGHQANRASRSDGHHDRLDKDTPVEVFEGALLAFGAPSAWWRVGWMPILVYPYHLHPFCHSQLLEISRNSGLAVLDPEKDNFMEASHLVVNVARAGSGTFLRCVVAGKQIVSQRWYHAVGAMVKDACSQASLAPTPEAARAATAIPPEDRFRPAFTPEDTERFGDAVLAQSFDASKDRKELFVGVTFVCPCEMLLDDWHTILTDCGANAVLRANMPNDCEKCVYLRPSGCRSAKSSSLEVYIPPSSPSCTEQTLIRAILSANADEILKATLEASAEPLLNTRNADVATPTPSDSDAETADNDQALDTEQVSAGAKNSRRKRPRRPAGSESGADPDSRPECDQPLGQHAGEDASGDVEEALLVGGDEPRKDPDGRQSRLRRKLRHAAGKKSTQPGNASPPSLKENEGGESPAIAEDRGVASNDGNSRTFFRVGPQRSQSSGDETAKLEDGAVNSAAGAPGDVRTFKRKRIPVAGRVGLEKYRAVEDCPRFDSRGSGKSGAANAENVDDHGGGESGDVDDDAHGDESDSERAGGSRGRSRSTRSRRPSRVT